MNILEILLIAIGLSMDAAAVSIGNGLAYPDTPRRRLVMMAAAFGLFQAIMPLIGYGAGELLANLIETYGSIIIALILGIVGANMIREGLGADDDDDLAAKSLGLRLILVQAIATSIDAFAIGIGFRAVATPLYSVILIGLTTFGICLAALLIGKHFGAQLENKAHFLGGAILLVMAVRFFFS